MFHSDLVQHRKRMKQLITFDGLDFGSITPMDIDGVIEYHDKAVILLEYKLKGCNMPDGQRLCLERLSDDCAKAGKISCVLLAEHETYDADEDVRAGEAIVKRIYWKSIWHKADGSTVGEYIERILEYVEKICK